VEDLFRTQSTNIEASLGTVVPQQTEIRWIDASANEYVEILMNDVL